MTETNFEFACCSEDLVSHVNPRNVVLCLLEVARLACTRYSFSPAPGLVELEQEIDREIQKELENSGQSAADLLLETGGSLLSKYERLYSTNGTAGGGGGGDHGWDKHTKKMDKLVEEAVEDVPDSTTTKTVSGEVVVEQEGKNIEPDGGYDTDNLNNGKIAEEDEDEEAEEEGEEEDETTLTFKVPEEPAASSSQAGDSGSYSNVSSSIPRSPSNQSVLSSTGSSSCMETNFGDNTSTAPSTPTPMTSELDHKVSRVVTTTIFIITAHNLNIFSQLSSLSLAQVMQIAKTYYGKEARQGVQRLSEGS